jgi:hypothetical protein
MQSPPMQSPSAADAVGEGFGLASGTSAQPRPQMRVHTASAAAMAHTPQQQQQHKEEDHQKRARHGETEQSPRTAPASAHSLRSTSSAALDSEIRDILGEDGEAPIAARASVDESFLDEIEKELEGE